MTAQSENGDGGKEENRRTRRCTAAEASKGEITGDLVGHVRGWIFFNVSIFPTNEIFFFLPFGIISLKVPVRKTKYAYSPRTSVQLPARKPRLEITAVLEQIRTCSPKSSRTLRGGEGSLLYCFFQTKDDLTAISIQINQAPGKEQKLFFLIFEN